MRRLGSTTLDDVSVEVSRPSYDRGRVTAGIAHIGVGGFHRAHQAMYIDRLLEQGGATSWGICGIGLLPADRSMRDTLRSQDYLYTLVIKHPDGRRQRRVVGSIVDYLYAPDDVEAVLERLAGPEIRIVTLTVTEGGYNFSASTGEFDLNDDGVQADLRTPHTPRTVFGIVVEALARRRARGVPPFTVLSCDNVQGNGEIARSVFTAFANQRDPGLGSWVHEQVRFPSSMVDRITPVTAESDRRENDEALGVRDDWPVVCEPFEQWVIEDDFSAGRPAWDEVGAQLVDDVEPYEHMKLRLLNSSHQAMCYFGVLAGYQFAHEAAADPEIAQLLRRYMDEEATPTLAPVPGIDLVHYKATLMSRFQNPEVRDTLARLCADSSNRIPKWLLPVVHDQLRTGGQVTFSAAIVASWARYAEGVDEQGRPLEVVDALADERMAAAKRRTEDPTAFLADPSLFGDLRDAAAFTTSFVQALESLWDVGAKRTVRGLVEAPQGLASTAGSR